MDDGGEPRMKVEDKDKSVKSTLDKLLIRACSAPQYRWRFREFTVHGTLKEMKVDKVHYQSSMSVLLVLTLGLIKFIATL